MIIFKKKDMKKFIYLILASLCFHFSISQNNLEFNRIILESGTNLSISNGSVSIIVPANKVWKITSASIWRTYLSTGLENTSNYLLYALFIKDHCLAYSGYTNNSSFHSVPVFPIWLPTGTYTIQLQQFQTTPPSSPWPVGGKYSISGVEFNITQ